MIVLTKRGWGEGWEPHRSWGQRGPHRERGLMEKASAPRVPSWAFPGPFALFCKILPQYLPAGTWRIATMSRSCVLLQSPARAQPQGVQNPVPTGLIHTGFGAATLNLGSEGFLPLFPQVGEPSWHHPPSEEYPAQLAPDPTQTQPGRQTFAVFIALHHVTPGLEFRLLPNSGLEIMKANCPSPLIDFQVALLNWVQLKF